MERRNKGLGLFAPTVVKGDSRALSNDFAVHKVVAGFVGAAVIGNAVETESFLAVVIIVRVGRSEHGLGTELVFHTGVDGVFGVIGAFAPAIFLAPHESAHKYAQFFVQHPPGAELEAVVIVFIALIANAKSWYRSGTFGDQVDGTTNGFGAVNGRSWAFYHFNGIEHSMLDSISALWLNKPIGRTGTPSSMYKK